MKQIRTTKYTVAVRWHIRRMGHATNVELLELLHKKYPKVSATTLHRITTRMVERGELQIAPPGPGNVLRFDANTSQHDHFMCTNCKRLLDAHLREMVRPEIEKTIGDEWRLSGRLTVTGLCKNCAEAEAAS
jgi:Fe2+ or Zn2+ uptake regulation protein